MLDWELWSLSEDRDDEVLELEDDPSEEASSRALYDFETASLRNEERVTSASERSHFVRPMAWAFWKVVVAFLMGQMEPRLRTAERPSVRT